MTALQPDPFRSRRILAFVALLLLIVLTPTWWLAKLTALAVGAFVLGSYREAWLTEGRFCRQLTLVFIPQPIQQWQLERFRSIETGYRDGSGGDAEMFVHPVMLAFWRCIDYLAPWHFGGWAIRLRLDNGKRVLAWQGISEDQMRSNRDRIVEHTQLPLAEK